MSVYNGRRNYWGENRGGKEDRGGRKDRGDEQAADDELECTQKSAALSPQSFGIKAEQTEKMEGTIRCTLGFSTSS